MGQGRKIGAPARCGDGISEACKPPLTGLKTLVAAHDRSDKRLDLIAHNRVTSLYHRSPHQHTKIIAAQK